MLVEQKVSQMKNAPNPYTMKYNTQAIRIKYEANELFEKCPFKLQVNIDKALTIVLLIPLINELTRTMNNAVADEDFNFSYVIDKVTRNVDQLRDNAKQLADQVKKGDYTHTNFDIEININAPVVKVYQNIFDEDSPYLELDCGKICIYSDLRKFEKGKDYNVTDNVGILYD
jgi:FtsZ-binding cell division protein ZapB